MKTLIFVGSPRKTGDTRALLSRVTAQLEGETVLVDAYRDDIHPCIDCRRCREQSGCVFRDDMQKVYDLLPECDNVVIAAPLYFSELPGQLLNVFSRLQCQYSARRFRGEKQEIKPKRGGIILVGGGNGGPENALHTCRDIFRYYMNVKDCFLPVMSLKTDDLSACEDEAALAGCDELAQFLNDTNR